MISPPFFLESIAHSFNFNVEIISRDTDTIHLNFPANILVVNSQINTTSLEILTPENIYEKNISLVLLSL